MAEECILLITLLEKVVAGQSHDTAVRSLQQVAGCSPGTVLHNPICRLCVLFCHAIVIHFSLMCLVQLSVICSSFHGQAAPDEYGNTDIYNACLFRIVLKLHNTGSADEMLYDQPLGWWDPDWAGCQVDRAVVDDDRWHYLATNHLAMHSRYPKKLTVPKNSSLDRVMTLVDRFWTTCSTASCMPKEGMGISAYDSYVQQPNTFQSKWVCHYYTADELDAMYGKDRSIPWSAKREQEVCEATPKRVFTLQHKERAPDCEVQCSCCQSTGL